MNNFPITIERDMMVNGENLIGKVIWHSRSMAVVVFMFCYYQDTWYVAAVQRGPGCPDNIGLWCCPCGYLDFNERIVEAAKRELYEETGLHTECHQLVLFGINDNPADSNRQNVTFRFIGTCVPETAGYGPMGSVDVELPKLTAQYSETEEVSDLKWIALQDIGMYNWAFGHEIIIFEAFRNMETSYDNAKIF